MYFMLIDAFTRANTLLFCLVFNCLVHIYVHEKFDTGGFVEVGYRLKVFSWVGLDPSVCGLDWVGKVGPWTSLVY